MSRNTVLDDIQLTYDFNDHLAKDEIIVWSDIPKPISASYQLKKSWDLLSVVFYFFILGMSFLVFGYTAAVIVIVTFISILITLPKSNFQFRKDRTRYALTNKRLFFKLWSITGTKIHIIPLEFVDRVTIDSEEDGRGTLYFFINKNSGFFTSTWYSNELDQPQFTTESIDRGETRQCPTFESIPNGEEVRQQIMTELSKNKKSVKQASEKQELPSLPDDTLELKTPVVAKQKEILKANNPKNS